MKVPFWHAGIPLTLCSSFWMRMESILEIYGFLTRQLCEQAEPVQFGEPRIFALQYHHLYTPKTMVWTAISSKQTIGPFLERKRRMNHSIIKFWTNLWRFKKIWMTNRTPHCSCKNNACPYRTLAVFDFLSEHFTD